jgi:hypothetical protein
VDWILQDLHFHDGASRVAQGQPQFQQGNFANRRRLVESACMSAREFRGMQPNEMVCHPRNLDTEGEAVYTTEFLDGPLEPSG